MVVCSGSDGSFLLTQLGAEKFYEAGMPVIALDYWNVPGTPQDVELSPVEYLQNACRWLKHKEVCNANREKSWQETLKFLREEWQV